MTWTATQATIADTLSGLLGIPVIWRAQGAPLPPRPFAAVQVTTTNPQGGSRPDSYTSPSAPGVVTLARHSRATMSIDVWSADTQGDGAAAQRLRPLALQLQTLAPREALFAAGVRIFSDGEIRDLSASFDAAAESRASLDLILAFVDTISEDRSWIETVNTDGIAIEGTL